MQFRLKVATFNMHKGVSSFSARLVLNKQRNLIRQLHADIVFLQEVRGPHKSHSKLTLSSQYEFLADSVWPEYAYGKNAIFSGGHYGNAILSKYPIIRWENIDISAHTSEQRGLLHCEILVPNWPQPLHCICVHFGLLSHWRRRQLDALNTHINLMVPKSAPLIIAGDFNDWRQQAGYVLAEQQLKEVFKSRYGNHVRSFPSVWPMFALDRIYTRGFNVENCRVHRGFTAANISDHAALTADLIGLSCN